MTSKAVAASFVSSTMSKNSNTAQPSSPSSEEPWDTNYGSTDAQEQRLTSPYQLHGGSSPPPDGIFRRATAPDAAEASDIDDDSLDEEYEMSLTELLYSSASYHAIVKPVTLTMTLAALSVVYINTEDTIAQGEEEMAEAYQVFKNDGGSNAQKLELSLANAFVLVLGICIMTFVIVALYHYRFMKCLIAYMMFASSSLLGVLGGLMWKTAIEIYRWPIDRLTFYFGLWNFAAVGVYSIFYQLGVPPFITQGYLVCTSVILAWQLAHFDAWSTWTLLIMLALYDLCAVLTPCGPLRALVHLMSKEDSPEMPGLLYEAELPSEAQRPGVPSSSMPRAQSDVAQPANNNNGNGGSAPTDDSVVAQRSVIPDDVPMATSSMENETNGANSTNNLGDPIVVVPLALARVYNLPIIDVPQPAAAAAGSPPDGRRSTPLLAHDIPDNPTIKQLKSDVTVRLPQNGGRLERIDERRRVYLERDRFGTPKRTVWVDAQGKVFAEAYQEGDEDPESNRKGNTIRLGLGDFIFYSVLVAKAAQYSFTTFCACILVILAGLGGTLVLLSVYHQALPALPISIFLGVVFYLFTRGLIEPWIHEVLRRPYYV